MKHATLLAVLFAGIFLMSPDVMAKSSKKKVGPIAPQQVVETVVDPEDHIIMAEASVVSSQDMGEMRAGFMDASGLMFKFAVDIKAQVDGALMFVRSLVLETVKSGGFHVASSSQVMPENLPTGTSVDVVNNGAGVVVSGDEGKTTMLNQPSNGVFSNVILNAANNRDIAQTMNIDLIVQDVKNNFGQFSALKNMNLPSSLFQSSNLRSIGLGR